MRLLTRTMAALSISTLLLVSGSVVVAQDDGATSAPDARAPAAVTGVVRYVGPNQTPVTASGEPPLLVTAENYGHTLLVETDDPRLSGEFETNQNVHEYVSGVALRSGLGHLMNEGGSWSGEFQGFTPGGGNHYIIYFTGEGGYEGLFAMLWMQPGGPFSEVTGVITPGPLPEPPDWVLPPTD